LKEGELDHYRRFSDWLVEIRLLIAQGRSQKEPALLQKAAYLAEGLQSVAEQDGRGQDLVRVLVLRAVALWHLNERAPALATLNRAFDLAEPEGFVRTFLDEDEPFSDLLTAALAQDVHALYAGRLQSEFHPASELYVTVSVASEQANLLSPRETEILRAIAKGMTTQAIAEQYYLSVFTVRTHIKRIFEKLGAHSRLQAVDQARARGLI
jgi:LuxR family maltose regulon positive regulatory protein